MAILSAAVAFVGVLCFFDLLLSFAVIRRLRQRAAEPHLPTHSPGLPVPGTQIESFAASTASGRLVTLDDLTGRPSAVAFFASDCPSCRDHLGEFTGFARKFPGGQEQVLAVIAGSAERGADLLTALNGVATVVIEPDQGPLQDAFSIAAFPTFFTLDASARVEAATPVAAWLPSAALA